MVVVRLFSVFAERSGKLHRSCCVAAVSCQRGLRATSALILRSRREPPRRKTSLAV